MKRIKHKISYMLKDKFSLFTYIFTCIHKRNDDDDDDNNNNNNNNNSNNNNNNIYMRR